MNAGLKRQSRYATQKSSTIASPEPASELVLPSKPQLGGDKVDASINMNVKNQDKGKT
jgi:hypothetical protein